MSTSAVADRQAGEEYVAYVEPPCCQGQVPPTRIAGQPGEHRLLLEQCPRCGRRWMVDIAWPHYRIWPSSKTSWLSRMREFWR